MLYKLLDDDRAELDAHFTPEEDSVIFHSRGGIRGGGRARNTDYGAGLKLLLRRLLEVPVAITGAWVDSAGVQSLPLQERRILRAEEAEGDPEELARLLSRRMKSVGRAPGATGGNSTRRIRIGLAHALERDEIEGTLLGRRSDANFRSELRLPADQLAKVRADHVWRAVQGESSGAGISEVEKLADWIEERLWRGAIAITRKIHDNPLRVGLESVRC